LNAPDIHNTDPQRLAWLMDTRPPEEKPWKPDELGDIFRHQMSAPVDFELTGVDHGVARRLKASAASGGLVLKSLRDLIHHSAPPIELLEMVKQFAKGSVGQPESPLPDEIARVIYFLVIGVARLRHGRKITTLDDASVEAGLLWSISQDWVDDATRSLLREALRATQSRKEHES